MVKVTIDAEASVGIQNLSFVVGYDGGILQLMSSSPGSFVQQASAPARLEAEDPYSGNVYVTMVVDNGGIVAAAGTVVVLEFEARAAGVAPIALRDVSFREGGHSKDSTTTALQPVSIAID